MNHQDDLHDELQNVWDTQEDNGPAGDPQALARAMHASHRDDQKKLWWLVAQETLPAIAVAAFFFWRSFAAQTAARQWALIGAAVLSLAVAAFLIATARRQQTKDRIYGSTLADELERRRSQLAHRVNLYRTVAWWYFAPLALAVVLAYVGSRPPGGVRAFDVGYAALALGGAVALYILNRRTGQRRYEPELETITALIADLEGDEHR